jgi:hypothetical protein
MVGDGVNDASALATAVGQRQVRQVHLFSRSSRLVSYRTCLQSCHFRVTEMCAAWIACLPNDLSHQNPLGLALPNYLVYLLRLTK